MSKIKDKITAHLTGYRQPDDFGLNSKYGLNIDCHEDLEECKASLTLKYQFEVKAYTINFHQTRNAITEERLRTEKEMLCAKIYHGLYGEIKKSLHELYNAVQSGDRRECLNIIAKIEEESCHPF